MAKKKIVKDPVVMGFEVTGSIEVAGKPVEANDGSIVGYKLKDGRVVKLCLALEIEHDGGKSYTYATSDRDMRKLGFAIGLYDKTDFTNLN